MATWTNTIKNIKDGFLLQEVLDYLLLEDGSRIIIDLAFINTDKNSSTFNNFSKNTASFNNTSKNSASFNNSTKHSADYTNINKN